MCFYNQKRWKCGYWRWDKFATRCPAERHMGETCGLKLVFKVFDQGPKCNICCDIDTKWRKISKMDRDLERWHREGNKPVTVELTLADRGAATAKIAELQQKHENDMKTLSTPSKRVQRPGRERPSTLWARRYTYDEVWEADFQQLPPHAQTQFMEALGTRFQQNLPNAPVQQLDARGVPVQSTPPQAPAQHMDTWRAPAQPTPPQVPVPHQGARGSRTQVQSPPFSEEYSQGQLDSHAQAQDQPFEMASVENSWRDRPQVRHPDLPENQLGVDEGRYQNDSQYTRDASYQYQHQQGAHDQEDARFQRNAQGQNQSPYGGYQEVQFPHTTQGRLPDNYESGHETLYLPPIQTVYRHNENVSAGHSQAHHPSHSGAHHQQYPDYPQPYNQQSSGSYQWY